MNNYCRNCGEKIEKKAQRCAKCNTEVLEKRINTTEVRKQKEEFKVKERYYILLIIVLYIFALISNIIDALIFISPIIFLIALITTIYARISLPNSKIIRFLFIFIIVVIVLYIFYAILIFTSCLNKMGL